MPTTPRLPASLLRSRRRAPITPRLCQGAQRLRRPAAPMITRTTTAPQTRSLSAARLRQRPLVRCHEVGALTVALSGQHSARNKINETLPAVLQSTSGQVLSAREVSAGINATGPAMPSREATSASTNNGAPSTTPPPKPAVGSSGDSLARGAGFGGAVAALVLLAFLAAGAAYFVRSRQRKRAIGTSSSGKPAADDNALELPARGPPNSHAVDATVRFSCVEHRLLAADIRILLRSVLMHGIAVCRRPSMAQACQLCTSVTVVALSPHSPLTYQARRLGLSVSAVLKEAATRNHAPRPLSAMAPCHQQLSAVTQPSTTFLPRCLAPQTLVWLPCSTRSAPCRALQRCWQPRRSKASWYRRCKPWPTQSHQSSSWASTSSCAPVSRAASRLSSLCAGPTGTFFSMLSSAFCSCAQAHQRCYELQNAALL